MIEDIKQDCPLNNTITIEFENEKISGVLIYIDDKKIKLQSKDKTLLLTASKLDSLVSYEVISKYSPLKEANVTSRPVEIIEVENKQNRTYANDVSIEQIDLSSFQGLFNKIEASNFFFSDDLFDFKIKKVNKFESDEETFAVYQQLQRVEAKYRYSTKVPDKENRYIEISRILSLLLSNNYFNTEIRYNLAFVYYQLNDKIKSIKTLVELQNYKEVSDNLRFLIFLLYDTNQLLKVLQQSIIYYKDRVIRRDEGLFLIKLIAQTKAYFLIDSIFEEVFRPNAIFEEDELFGFTLYFGRELEDDHNFYFKNPTSNIQDRIKSNINLLKDKTPESIQNKIEAFQLEKNSENILIANAEITQYWINSEQGNLIYIDNKKRKFLASFKATDIMEQEIRSKLKDGEITPPIPVFCFIEDSNFSTAVKRGLAIQLPKSVKLQIDAVKNWIRREEFDIARGVLSEILHQFPEEYKCQELLNSLPEPEEKEISKPSRTSKRSKKNSKTFKYYNQANIARQQQKWEEAKLLFAKAIELNQKKESAIKDLASIYQREGANEKAIMLVEKNLDQMQNKESSYNFLSQLYFTNGQYQDTIKILKKVLVLKPTKKVDLKKRSTEIKKRLAYTYVKAEKYTEAKKLLNDIIKNTPKDLIAKKWLEGLKEAEQTGQYQNIDSLFSDTDFNILMTGLSPLMINTLENCDYTGLKATEIAEENFTQSVLNKLRKDINETLGNKPKQRASYRLTEAKLMQILEPENEPRMKSVLAKYCNDIALSCAGSNFPSVVIRSFYIEAFSLEMEWKSLARQVSLYLSTFYLTGEQIIIENQKGISFEKAINNIFELDETPRTLWDSILEMSIVNPTITAKILWKIYSDQKVRRSAFQFLNRINIKIIEDSSENKFKLQWNKAREKRKSEYDAWFDKIYALTNTQNINALAAIIQKTLIQINLAWLNDLDSIRLQSIQSDVVNSCLDYLKQDIFDEKERLYNNIITSITRLVSEIQEKPTRFSYEGFLPLLKHIEELMDSHFKNILDSSTPIISLQVQGEAAAIQGKMEIEVAILNEDKQKAPIYDTTITIEDSKNFSLIGEPVTYYETIRGGEQESVKISLSVSQSIINQKIGDVELICKYKARNLNEYVTIKSGQTIPLYDEKEFIPIDNIFARYANSNAVKEEDMFKGRDDIIDNIVTTLVDSQSKCVVIYGQKRSGKSSVLYHLKQRLNNTEKAFCLEFSLGSIITEWSIALFYNKILHELSKELRKVKRQGLVVPNFNRPSLEELEKHPNSVFQESIEAFLEDCLAIKEWKDRKLTVLIDEFTYLYSSIQRKTIPDDFMKVWKNIVDQGYFNTVLVGQDVMPDFMAQFPNEFGVADDHRLNYLDYEDAKDLIEAPIWDEVKDKSRFLGKSVDKIIDYTAGNPYYIQIFCDRLVSFLNKACRSQVTELTVDAVAKSLTIGKEALLEKQFDNLLTAGDADLERNPLRFTYEVLKQIAKASKNFGYCSRESIIEHIIEEMIIEKLDDILKDLHLRQVVSLNQGNYRIQVQLFQQWLLNR